MPDSIALVFQKHNISRDYDLLNDGVGEGGFGSVVRCVHKDSKAVRACKKIPKGRIQDAKMFAREVSLQAALDHPHICRVFDCYEDWWCYYIVLELCEGGSLFDRISVKTSDRAISSPSTE